MSAARKRPSNMTETEIRRALDAIHEVEEALMALRHELERKLTKQPFNKDKIIFSVCFAHGKLIHIVKLLGATIETFVGRAPSEFNQPKQAFDA
jgi:hypothetical protein